jgi:P4 family phage/plasmid primase-like protien
VSGLTPLGRDKAAQNLAELIAAIEASGEFGRPVNQSGSNGPETLFRCPLCANAGKDSKGRMLRVARRLDGGDLPYVGCRNHEATEMWKELRTALVDAGVPGRLLAGASGGTSGRKTHKSEPPAGGFPERPDGLGETEPVDDEQIAEWCARLWHPTGRKYLRYLEARGLTPETIETAQLGLGAFVWTKGKKPSPRITIPIFDADGNCVNVRLASISKGSKRMPLPHPEYRKVDEHDVETAKFLTYGPPTRLYGVDAVVADDPDWVFFLAGEWDKLLGEQAGLYTVTGTGGEKALPRYADAQHLAGRNVVVIYDCDEAGRTGALKVARACRSVGCESVRVLDLDPARDDGYDLGDYLAKDGGDVDELLQRVADLPEWEDTEPPSEDPPPWELSDRGLAEQVAYRCAGTLRYVPESDSWIAWDPAAGVWSKYHRKDLIAPAEAVVSYVRETRTQLADAEEESAEALWYKFVHQYLNTGKINSAATALSQMWDMRIRIADIDAKPELLNLQNGTLDLGTGRLGAATSGNFITKRTNGALLLDGAETDGEREWNSVLERSVPDVDTRLALQQVCGISLLDGNPLQVMVFLLGGTGTGKSVFSELFMYALGDYAGSFNLSMFRDNQDEKPRADLVRALTQRVIFASEASEQWRLHVDQIKRLTGEDTITARLPHSGEYIERMPAFMPWFRTNQAPHIETPDLALYRRLLVFPFEQAYGGKGRSGYVRRTKGKVASAVLTWAVQGLEAWRDSGAGELAKSAEMVRAELALREALNDTQVFLAEETEPDAGVRVAVKELYDRYVDWAFNAGIPTRDVLTKDALGKRLTGLGYGSKKSNGIVYRTGLRLRKGAREVR